MDLSYSPEESAFRDEVRAFLAENLPAEISDKVARGVELDKAEMERWHAILNRKGLACWRNWPREHGGCEGWGRGSPNIFSKRNARWPMRRASCPLA
jgi:alkylation response protein AidB-like acyl-CoA dehydrogenase